MSRWTGYTGNTLSNLSQMILWAMESAVDGRWACRKTKYWLHFGSGEMHSIWGKIQVIGGLKPKHSSRLTGENCILV